ncbi:TIGR01906 family membrane protein [Chloroflexota bacterium]
MQRCLRILSVISRWFFILCFPAMLLTAGICIAVNCQPLYEYGFNKYNIEQKTGLEDTQLEKAASGLIGYFSSDEEIIDITLTKDGQPFVLFNEKEVAHLKDVKGLIHLDYWVLLGTSIYALLYVCINTFWRKEKYRQWLAREVIDGSGFTLSLMLLLGLMVLLNFERVFLQFHLISFTNDLWQLDPTKDYLIMLFPQGFWYDAVIFCTLLTVGLAVLLGGVAGGYLFIKRRKAKSQVDLLQ